MPGFKKKQPTRNLTRLFHLLGVKFPEDTPKLERSENVELNSFTQNELRYMPGMSILEPKRRQIDTAGMSEYLTKVASGNNDWVRQADAIRVLTPEIDRSCEIMVSSIISPTDMQTDTINVVCEDTDLGEEIEQKVGSELSSFFNNTVEIGDLVYRCTKEALYGSGSAAILILPPKNIDILNRTIDADMFKAGAIKVMPRKRHKVVADNPILHVSNETLDNLFSSQESLLPDETTDSGIATLNFIKKEIEQDLSESLERWNPFTNIDNKEVITGSKEARNQILKLFRSENKHIIISSDVNGIRRGKDRLKSRIERMAQEVEKNFLFSGDSSTFLVSDENHIEDNKNPAIIEIPTGAVVPVIVPGTPDKHIGYFILVDQWGNPVVNVDDSDTETCYSPKKLTEAATQAAFGGPTLYRFSSTMTDSQRYDITSTIFGITLKRLMENKLEEFGMSGTTIEEHDAIAGCVFRSLLKQKKCALVFVPEPLMIYYRFQHRPDGTGKSITESISTMLALRTVLVMSYVMAATENSVDNKIISVNVDEKQTNIQQYLDMVRNAYVAKKMMRFDINPLTVQQDLIQKSLTILPKGIKGLSDSLDVQTEHRSSGAIMPDNDLMEKLSNWIITALEVPHSALNQLSENEYSRSVATTNLFFSNNVKSKQKIVIKHMSKFVKLYTRYSAILHNKITQILKASESTAKENKSTEAHEIRSSHKIETNNDSLQKKINTIISHIKISLPSPRIVVDKSQYAEIEQYIGTVEKICDTIYNDELLPADAQDLNDTLKTIRATIRASMTRDYIDNIGFQSSYDLPFPDDVDTQPIEELMMFLGNKTKGFKDWMTHIVNKASSDDIEGDNPENQKSDDMNDNTSTSEGGNDDNSNDDVDFDNFEEPPSFDEKAAPEETTTSTADTEKSKDETKEKPSKATNEAAEDDFDNFPPPPSF